MNTENHSSDLLGGRQEDLYSPEPEYPHLTQVRETLKSFLREKALCKGARVLAMCCPLEPYSGGALDLGKWKPQSLASFTGLPDKSVVLCLGPAMMADT